MSVGQHVHEKDIVTWHICIRSSKNSTSGSIDKVFFFSPDLRATSSLILRRTGKNLQRCFVNDRLLPRVQIFPSPNTWRQIRATTGDFLV
jgi:hypothetical protein